MEKVNKIAKKIYASMLTVRDLMDMKIELNMTDNFKGNWTIKFKGPVKLTEEAYARWNLYGVFDKKVLINGNEGIILDINNDYECKHICALFNTISGSVNDYTYKKYIQEK